LILICIIIAIRCEGNDCPGGCNGHGTCISSKCNCETFYSGENCSISQAQQYSYFNAEWSFYGALGTLLNLILFSFAAYQIYNIIRLGWKWTVVTISLILFLTGTLMRIIGLGIDPLDFRGILGPPLSDFLGVIPTVAYINAGFLIMLYWIEIQNHSGIKSLRSIRKLRPVMIVLWVLTLVTLLPVSLWDTFDSNPTSDAILGGLVAVFFIILIISFLISGLRLRRMIRTISINAGSSSEEVQVFLKKVSNLLFAFCFFGVIIVITIIIVNATSAAESPWGFCVERIISKILEFGVVMSFLIFLNKKKPKAITDLPSTEEMSDTGFKISGRSQS